MKDERRGGNSRKVDELFQAALNRQPGERRAFLAEVCGSDTDLLVEVESLISAHDQAEGFLESPAVELVAASLDEGTTRLERGQQLGPYTIVGPLGMGGMGEVYRARDTRLERTVAIKVLPSHLSADSERRERFEREARAISRMNHPHICTLYDIGQHDGFEFLVIEYVEGKTLAHRLEKGAMPLDQAVQVTMQIADALDKAHNEGLVHRDVKPGNIMLAKSGAKLLDFGLAKLRDPRRQARSGEEDSLTAPGALLGTFQYMAPEQLQGKDADARTDIFALGAVLYEMVTKKKAFAGKNQASLIAAILEHEPAPLADSRPEISPLLEHVVQRCLAKDPEERWQTVKDMARTLKWVESGPVGRVPARASRFALVRMLPWVVAAIAVAALLVTRIIDYRQSPAELRLRFAIPLPEEASPGTTPSLAASADGHLAFVAHKREAGKPVSGRPVLWVRPPESSAWRDLPGTENVMNPFWSPDSRSIGFFAQGKLKRVWISGGPPQTVCDTFGTGGTWSQDGVILFGLGDVGGFCLYQVPAAGGMPIAVTALDKSRQEEAHLDPHFLPDGRHFLYFVRSPKNETQGIYVGSLDTPLKKHVLEARHRAYYAAPGYLLVGRTNEDGGHGTLMAYPFDLKRLEIAGEPVPIEQVGTGATSFSASGNLLVYRPHNVDTELAWFDRSGKKLSAIDDHAWHPALSPDERRFAVERDEPHTRNVDIWLWDLKDTRFSRLTLNPAIEAFPVWSPDGSRILFASSRKGSFDLYQKLADGTGPEVPVLESSLRKYPWDWSSDGQFICYAEGKMKPRNDSDLWILPFQAIGRRFRCCKQFNEFEGQFSPEADGPPRWIAYTSTQSGRDEVYVTAFPGQKDAGRKWTISRDGGGDPRWRRDGKELFYLNANQEIVAVEVRTVASPEGLDFEVGRARTLFRLRYNAGGHFYNVSRDGQRFLANVLVEEIPPSPIMVVVNWAADLRK